MIADFSTIVARELGIRRGGRWVLRPATFGIGPGVVGLADPSGSDASALLATFATLRRPATGRLELLGHDVTRPPGRRAARARLGFLPGRFGWASGLTVGDFVDYAGYFTGVTKEEIGTVLERFGIADVTGLEMEMLPADLRLRAGLAAACAHRPGVVLLDEPLTGIGEGERDDLIRLLRGLAPTVVVSAPDPAGLTGWCDRVLRLARGRLVESLGVPRPRDRVPAGV